MQEYDELDEAERMMEAQESNNAVLLSLKDIPDDLGKSKFGAAPKKELDDDDILDYFMSEKFKPCQFYA